MKFQLEAIVQWDTWRVRWVQLTPVWWSWGCRPSRGPGSAGRSECKCLPAWKCRTGTAGARRRRSSRRRPPEGVASTFSERKRWLQQSSPSAREDKSSLYWLTLGICQPLVPFFIFCKTSDFHTGKNIQRIPIKGSARHTTLWKNRTYFYCLCYFKWDSQQEVWSQPMTPQQLVQE